VRVRLPHRHVRNSIQRLRVRLIAASVVLLTASVAVPFAVAATAQPLTQHRAPETVHIDVSGPASVTRGGSAALTARLSLGSAPLVLRTVQFRSRLLGATQWQPLATEQTDANGRAAATLDALSAPTEFSVSYDDVAGAVHRESAAQVVHVIDLKPATPRAVVYNAQVRIQGHLLRDGVEGIAAQLVQVRFRASAKNAWGAPHMVRTDASGVATLAQRLTHTQQVGIRFPGAAGLAASPLAITTIQVRPRSVAETSSTTTSSGGFVFPFQRPSQAASVGAWTLDQGVDISADGYACGAAAVLVAVGDGVVIQEGISGFGPTAPVIRMTSGPFKGRNVYYGHTGHVYVPVGAHVSAGQPLAQIGCGHVGNSQAPHVEIGVGEPGGPPCCPPMRATASQMYDQLLAALRG
jgi:murein DD-endopeptidase MepM/ murein hydrolase activator NlpD